MKTWIKWRHLFSNNRMIIFRKVLTCLGVSYAAFQCIFKDKLDMCQIAAMFVHHLHLLSEKPECHRYMLETSREAWKRPRIMCDLFCSLQCWREDSMMRKIKECTYQVSKNNTTQKLFIMMAWSLALLYKVPRKLLNPYPANVEYRVSS